MTNTTSKLFPLALAAILVTLGGAASAQTNFNTTIQEGRINTNDTSQRGAYNDNATYQEGRDNANRAKQQSIGCSTGLRYELQPDGAGRNGQSSIDDSDRRCEQQQGSAVSV